jgi:uncharacterized membrane protein (UPF0127 family)
MLFVAARRSVRRVANSLVLVGFLSACIVSACAQSSKLPVVEGRFLTTSGAETPSFKLEVCANDGERSMGLMYRRALAKDAGMIFLFPEERHNSFWMKNTYIPLDMVFVGRDMKVVGVLHNVPPLNELPRSVGKPSMYVLEFAAGTMKVQGVEEGAELKISQPLPKAH